MDGAGEPALGVAGLLRRRGPFELPGLASSDVGAEEIGEAVDEAALESDIATEIVDEVLPPPAIDDIDGISSEP